MLKNSRVSRKVMPRKRAETRLFWSVESKFECIVDLLRDRVYPVTRRSNASECDVTFERYCTSYVF